MSGSQEARLRARVREQQRAIVRASLPLERLLMHPGRVRGLDVSPEEERDWSHAMIGSSWGGSQEWTWFRAWFRVPPSWADQKVRLSLPLGGQAMVYLDGRPWQGLDENHRSVVLPPQCFDGASHVAAVEAYASPVTTVARKPTDMFTVGECRLELLDSESEAFYYDLAVGVEALAILPEASVERVALLRLLVEAENTVNRTEPTLDEFRQSVARARAHVQRGLEAIAVDGAAHRPTINAVGHAHIDTAWLWPSIADQTKSGSQLVHSASPDGALPRLPIRM